MVSQTNEIEPTASKTLDELCSPFGEIISLVSPELFSTCLLQRLELKAQDSEPFDGHGRTRTRIEPSKLHRCTYKAWQTLAHSFHHWGCSPHTIILVICFRS